MEGPWIKVPKTPESTERSEKPITLIHDDEVAKSLGYKGGFVGGSTVMGISVPAIFASFSHIWYESGAYYIRLTKPVFAGDEVRVVWEEAKTDYGDKRKIAFHVEGRDGTQSAVGWAALGNPGEKLTPPWMREPAPPSESADDLIPEQRVGDEYPIFTTRMTRDKFIPKFDGIQDYNWWYRVTSPWGAPIVPPSELGIMCLSDTVQRAGDLKQTKLRNSIWSGFEAVVYAPVFVDRDYHFRSWICEQGKTPRSVFVTTEYIMNDENERRIAVLRHKARYLISDLIRDGKKS